MHPKSFVSNFWGALHNPESGYNYLYQIHTRVYNTVRVIKNLINNSFSIVFFLLIRIDIVRPAIRCVRIYIILIL